MKKLKNPPKIKLNAEKLNVLSTPELAQAAGAANSMPVTICVN